MKRKINKVLVVANLDKDNAEQLIGRIKVYMRSHKIDVTVFSYRGEPKKNPQGDFDLAIILGGDGTILYGSRILSSQSIPILAVNLGKFGFITEIAQEEWKSAFEKYQSGDLCIGERIILDVKLLRNGETLSAYKGLNDAVVSASGISKIVNLNLSLSSVFVGRYRADGIIISTPTGSTAYSAAAGGPILHPEMEAIIINPICPFTLSHRPLVIRGDETVRIQVEEHQRTDIMLTVDGQSDVLLFPGDEIVISKAAEKARIIRSDKRSFYDVLRSKLNWSGGPHA
jgi:NAD+ kinase